MAREQQPSSVHLRMSPQLHAALRDAATAAGGSLNAFATQVLSAAAGDASRFRGVAETRPDVAAAPANQTWRRRAARNEFIGVMGMEIGSVPMIALVRRLDREDPGHYLEWQRKRNEGGDPGVPGASRRAS